MFNVECPTVSIHIGGTCVCVSTNQEGWFCWSYDKKTSFVNSGEQAHARKTRDVTMQPAVILRRHPVERAAYGNLAKYSTLVDSAGDAAVVSNRCERPDIRYFGDSPMQRTHDQTALGIQIPRFTIPSTAAARWPDDRSQPENRVMRIYRTNSAYKRPLQR